MLFNSLKNKNFIKNAALRALMTTPGQIENQTVPFDILMTNVTIILYKLNMATNFMFDQKSVEMTIKNFM